MGNEMGNQNVSGLQVEEEPMKPETPAKASEAALSSSDLESLHVKKVSVPTTDNVRGNGNQSSSDLANVSEVDGGHIQDQASTGRDSSATANSGNHVEILLPPNCLDGGEKEKIPLSPSETEDLPTKFKNPGTTNSHESGNHQIQNEASTGRGQEDKIPMESEGKKNCDQKPSIDACSYSSMEQGSGALVSPGDVVLSNGSCNFGENNDETDWVEQLDRKSISELRDVKTDGDEGATTAAELDVSRIKTTELPSNDLLESFYPVAIDSDIMGVFLGDDSGTVGMGAELEMNVRSQGSVLVSQEDGKVSVDAELLPQEDVKVTVDAPDLLSQEDGKVSVDALELFYLEAINSEIEAVCLSDDLHATGMGDEMNAISKENDQVLPDNSNIDKNDMLQTDSSVIEAAGREKKPLVYDEISDFGIEKSPQAEYGEQTESGQQIKLHDGLCSLMSEKDVEEGLDNEREDNDNSLLLPLPVTECVAESIMEEREDADPKGEECEGLWSDSVKQEDEQDSNFIFNGGSMNEENLRPVLPQHKSLKQETDLVLPILVPPERQQEPVTENAGTETKTLEPRETLEQESCFRVHSGDGFGNSSGSPRAETSELTPELETVELEPIESADGSLNENGDVPSAISSSLSQKEEMCSSLTKFSSENEQKTRSDMSESGEMPSTKSSQANFDCSEMHTTDSDLENSLVETEVPALKTQKQNIEERLSHYKNEWAAQGINGPCETDEENQDIQLHATDGPSIEVSAPQMMSEAETGSGEPLSDEENRKDQGILGTESHLSETTAFDYLPSTGKSSITALKPSPALPEHEAFASESSEEVQEDNNIQIDISENSESDFALPPTNAEVSVVETKMEEFGQKTRLQQASIPQDEASQALENSEKSVIASGHDEESATKLLHRTCSSTDLKNQTSETDLQILKTTKNESLEGEPDEKEVFALERSNAEKLKTPLPNSVKKETLLGEPLQKQASIPQKKTAKEDWGSPKKVMTTSAKGRGKPKSRYSLFSHCMCCTTVIQ